MRCMSKGGQSGLVSGYCCEIKRKCLFVLVQEIMPHNAKPGLKSTPHFLMYTHYPVSKQDKETKLFDRITELSIRPTMYASHKS